jgi:acyl-CoA synthetase (NDP forming)
MAQPGVEMLVGVLADERLGPVVACAAGGEAVQEIADVQVRLAPVARGEATEMVRALRASALLERERADVDALADVIVRVAALADAHPAIAELDCNPVIVSPGGALAIDARVRVAPPAARLPFPALNA